MEVFPSLNTVVLVSSDAKVIDWCRHSLEPVFSVTVSDSVRADSYTLSAFPNPVIIDTAQCDGAAEKFCIDIAHRARILFLVKSDSPFPLSYVQRYHKSCIPFPCDSELLRTVVKRHLPETGDIDRILKKPVHPFSRAVDISGFRQFIGSSKIIVDVKRRLAEVAPKDLSVLLLGESGTGKTFAAKLLHDNSSRKDKSFVSVEMSSVSASLAESELFGEATRTFCESERRNSFSR